MLIKDSDSPMFKHSLVYRPFAYPQIEEKRVEHEEVHWVTKEAEISDDVSDWRLNSSADERTLIKTMLTVFTTGDVVVAGNYVDQFLPVFKNNEIRNWLLSVAAREAIHQEAYALVNDTFGLPDSLFSKFKEFKEMRERVDLMATAYDITTVEGVALALAHTTFNEGVALFGAFITLLNFNRFDVPGHEGKKGRFKGFAKINKWSLREESMHVEVSSFLHKQIFKEHRHLLNDEIKKKVYDIARATVAAEDKFLDLAFENFDLPTITKAGVKKYIRYMVDRRLVQLGYKPNYHIKENPEPWVDDLIRGAGGKKSGNFFETRIDDYSASGATVGEVDWDDILSKGLFTSPE